MLTGRESTAVKRDRNNFASLLGALAPALRAMLAMAPGDALERAMNEGVGAALSARGEGGELRFPGLALRASALIAFWLDPDFTRLA